MVGMHCPSVSQGEENGWLVRVCTGTLGRMDHWLVVMWRCIEVKGLFETNMRQLFSFTLENLTQQKALVNGHCGMPFSCCFPNQLALSSNSWWEDVIAATLSGKEDAECNEDRVHTSYHVLPFKGLRDGAPWQASCGGYPPSLDRNLGRQGGSGGWIIAPIQVIQVYRRETLQLCYCKNISASSHWQHWPQSPWNQSDMVDFTTLSCHSLAADSLMFNFPTPFLVMSCSWVTCFFFLTTLRTNIL